MKRLAFLSLAISGLVLFSSCEKVVGEGPVVTENRAINGFQSLQVSISGKVNFKVDPVVSLDLRGQQNVLDVIQTNISGNELIIKVRDGKRIKGNEDIEINITGPSLQSIHLSGSAELGVTGSLVASTLDLRVSGSGNMLVQETQLSNRLSANVSGSGNIKIVSGVGKEEELKVSGSGNIDFTGLQAEKAITEISGSGNIRVKLSQALDAHISGSGSVLYLGNPVISSHISGSGSVRPI